MSSVSTLAAVLSHGPSGPTESTPTTVLWQSRLCAPTLLSSTSTRLICSVSLAFAFNLFLPFLEGSRERLSERFTEIVGTRLTIDKVSFEWVPPGGLLGELDGERPVDDEPATGVDVALWSWLENRSRAVVLVEVKLSEGNFTHCGGRISRGNRRRDVCESGKLFLDDPNACYLRRPWRKQRNRRYWEIFAMSHGSVLNAFPMPTSMEHVHSHTTCSSPCGTLPSLRASNRRTWLSGHGLHSALTTLALTLPHTGRTGNVFLPSHSWRHLSPLQRSSPR